jgi:hypothetical protein
MNKPFTREEFDRRRSAANKIMRSRSIVAAAVSVSLGLILLLFLDWANEFFSETSRKIISVATFIVFIAIVGWLLFRMKQAARDYAINCPKCGKALEQESQRIASATGKCDQCGGVVIEF